MTKTRDRVLAIARAELGTGERADGSSKYGEWYERVKSAPGFRKGPWCQMFTAWCADRADIPERRFPRMAYTPYAVKWFKDRGRWGTRPRVGALIYFNFPGGDAVDHVEIVEAIRADGTVVTIGGNVGNRVQRVNRRSNIAGYGYPDYSDPKPAAPPKPKPTATEVLVKQLPNLKLGDGRQGDPIRWDVKTVHYLLMARAAVEPVDLVGVDDTVFAPIHAAGVRKVQKANSLPETGRVDERTWAALLRVD
jgi:hypothetical protein